MMFFVGGVRSGKSRLAEQWIEEASPERLYLATARPTDAEMAARIEAHRASRKQNWKCLESCLYPEEDLRNFLESHPGFHGAILFDCLSTWLANLLELEAPKPEIMDRAVSFLKWFSGLPLPCAIVSLECGLGFVPMSGLARSFGDILGLINQESARLSVGVVLVHCGLPLWLKGHPTAEIERR